jgi:hypothetical protein
MRLIAAFCFHDWHVREFHAFFSDYISTKFTSEKASVLGLGDSRNNFIVFDTGMSKAGVENAYYHETKSINDRFSMLYKLSQGLVLATDYFAYNPTATTDEQAGAKAVYGVVQFLRGLTMKPSTDCLETVSNVTRALLKTPEHLTAFRQLSVVQQMVTIHNEIEALSTSREHEHAFRRGPNSGTELKRAVEPLLIRHFEDLEFLARHGTAEQKEIVEELVAYLNAVQQSKEAIIKMRRTRRENKKKKPDNQENGQHSDDNEDADDGNDANSDADTGEQEHDDAGENTSQVGDDATHSDDGTQTSTQNDKKHRRKTRKRRR